MFLFVCYFSLLWPTKAAKTTRIIYSNSESWYFFFIMIIIILLIISSTSPTLLLPFCCTFAQNLAECHYRKCILHSAQLIHNKAANVKRMKHEKYNIHLFLRSWPYLPVVWTVHWPKSWQFHTHPYFRFGKLINLNRKIFLNCFSDRKFRNSNN